MEADCKITLEGFWFVEPSYFYVGFPPLATVTDSNLGADSDDLKLYLIILT